MYLPYMRYYVCKYEYIYIYTCMCCQMPCIRFTLHCIPLHLHSVALLHITCVCVCIFACLGQFKLLHPNNPGMNPIGCKVFVFTVRSLAISTDNFEMCCYSLVSLEPQIWKGPNVIDAIWFSILALENKRTTIRPWFFTAALDLLRDGLMMRPEFAMWHVVKLGSPPGMPYHCRSEAFLSLPWHWTNSSDAMEPRWRWHSDNILCRLATTPAANRGTGEPGKRNGPGEAEPPGDPVAEVFNGDFVDRGEHQPGPLLILQTCVPWSLVLLRLEVVALLFSLHVVYPMQADNENVDPLLWWKLYSKIQFLEKYLFFSE